MAAYRTVWPWLRRASAAAAAEAGELDLQGLQQGFGAGGDGSAGDLSLDALAGDGLEASDGEQGQAALFGGGEDRGGEGMLAGVFEAGNVLEEV